MHLRNTLVLVVAHGLLLCSGHRAESLNLEDAEANAPTAETDATTVDSEARVAEALALVRKEVTEAKESKGTKAPRSFTSPVHEADKVGSLRFPYDEFSETIDKKTRAVRICETDNSAYFAVVTKTGDHKVIKIYFITVSEEVKLTMLSQQSHKGTKLEGHSIQQRESAAKECELLNRMRKAEGNSRKAPLFATCVGADTVEDNGSGKLSRSIMPVYEEFEYRGGEETLNSYFFRTVNDRTWSETHLRRALKRILVGLSELHKAKIVHHDLSGNTVFMGQPGENGQPDVFFSYLQEAVDLNVAPAVEDKDAPPCRYTMTNMTAAPPEWGERPVKETECAFNFHPDYPFRFDTYSFAKLVFELVTGYRFEPVISELLAIRQRLLTNMPEEEVDSFDPTMSSIESSLLETKGIFYERGLTAREKLLTSNKFFVEFHKHFVKKRDLPIAVRSTLDALMRSKKAVKFLTLVARGLSRLPQVRPSAEDLLNQDWMKEAPAAF